MKVLLAIDDSDAALQACRWLAAYAGDRRALEITLLNVQRPPVQAAAGASELMAALDDALQKQGERDLERARQLLNAAGYKSAGLVRIGSPAQELLQASSAAGADVMLMGAGRQGVLGGYAIGSVALRVAPAADCPVVLVKPGIAPAATIGITTCVTVPVDGSAESTAAVKRLVSCARMLGQMHVDLVHFRPGLTLAEAMMPPHDDVLRSWSGRDADEAFAGPVQLLAAAGIARECHRLTGDPGSAIAAFAKSRGADLIAMGSRGTGAMHHLLLGSTALRTAHVSEVPVAFLR